MACRGWDEKFRVVSWNVWGSDSDQLPTLRQRSSSIVDALKNLGAHAILLQETDLKTAALVGDALGMTMRFGKNRQSDEGCAVLYRGPASEDGVFTLPSDGGGRVRLAAWMRARVHGHDVTLVSAHLAWGADQENVRVRQAQALTHSLLRGHVDIEILGGDLNAPESSDTLRWLTGLSAVPAPGAMFVDAFAVAGRGEGWTTGPSLRSSHLTAQTVGILRPELIPCRRIDYVLVHGWAFGRAGCPVDSFVVDPPSSVEGVEASDHRILVADLWIPDRCTTN